MIAAPKVSNNSVARSFGSSLTLRVCLYAAVAFSLTAAITHLWVMPGHFSEWWGYGVFFAAAALAQGIYAILLLRGPGRRLYLAGIAGNLAIVSGFVAAYTAGMPLGPHAGVAHPINALGIVATGSELALVLALVVLSGSFSTARTYVLRGAVLAFGSGLVLHALYAGTHAARGLDPILHWAWNSLLAIPLAALMIWLATSLARRILLWSGLEDSFSSRITWALVVAAAYAGASIPSDIFAMPKVGTDSFLASALGDGGAVLGAAFLLLFGLASMLGLPWDEPKTINFWRPRAAAVAAGLVAAIAVVAGPSLLGQDFSKPAVAQQASQTCSTQSYDRSYDVAAVNVKIPYNRFADPGSGLGGTARNMDEHGQAFVLQGDKEAVKNWSKPLEANPQDDPAQNRRLRPRPLVIRANVGECVKVTLRNELNDVGGDGLPNNPRASMKVFGPAYDAQTSDGGAVGFNKDTTVGQGETIEYYWKAPAQEGLYLFRDQGALAGSEANSGSTSHGLYGGFSVEPAGSSWLDPETGKPVYAGERNHTRITKESGDPYIDADIVPPGAKSFRETVQVSQDELPGGNGFSFNYGAEPARNRIARNPAGQGDFAGQFAPDAIGEETSLSSWTYGDPALIKLASGEGPWLPDENRTNKEDCGLEGSCYVSNVTHSYIGDPSKIRFAHAGVKETHVFHMHAHQWLSEPNDPKSNTIDSQTYGPGETFTADLIGGSGSKPGTFGDSIFHCHLYPHFADGFWALFRTHDVLEDGTNKTPDGINVRNLEPLAQGKTPPSATADNPGYPRFMPGKFGWRAPQPPKGISESNGQQDDANTVEREDLSPADRMVAGKPLNLQTLAEPKYADDSVAQQIADKLRVEQKVMDRNAGGAKPGAPFAEPCPSGSREVTYNVSVIQTDIKYNKAGWHDTQGRILVPTKDAEAVLAGDKKPEPMFIRVNAGDCINFNLTNNLPNWFGGDAFVKLAQTNMVGEHIHLVKFDVLASDGSSNGWNYQQAAFSDEQADFNKKVAAGEESCDWNGCRIENPPADWDPNTSSADVAPGQTIHERWYADYELRTVFTHDHHFAALDQNRGLFGALIVEPKGVDFRNPKTGDFYQPGNGSTAGAPNCGAKCTGDAAGTAMDIIGPGANDDFREFGMAVQDFASLTKEGGDPANAADAIEAPASPEEFPDADPGTMAINYSNEPLALRNEGDPAHAFSSTVHGDPSTPILQTYSEDPVRIRMIQGAQEEQHVMNIHGMRWREEPNNPQSPLVNSKTIGVSEAFNFQVPKITCGPNDQTCAGDYLYSSSSTDALYQGAWGILRARGSEVPSLLPLPDNVPQAGGQTVSSSAVAPPDANSPGNPCPTGSGTKKYEVVAMDANIEYNKDGDHDPNGLIYALASDEQAIKSGQKKPEPLVLRANQGDCIEVGLTNKISQEWLNNHPNAGTDGDPTLPTEPESGTPAGLRVSLHPQLVKYDVRGSDGTAVGYNRDQTVGSGERKLYRWYADQELGTTNLTDFGDVRGHRHHGLFAGLNIEPKGATTYNDPRTGEQIKSGASADIRIPGTNNDFREFTTFFQDGLNLRDKNNAIIEDPFDHPPLPGEPAAALDAEDQGEKGFNYANAPFSHRLGENMDGLEGSDMANVFNSRVHGDPDTPIFRSYAGDPVRMRVLQGSDKPRQHSFQVSGHSWLAQPDDLGSTLIGTQGGISVSRTINVELSGAGNGFAGDYRYGTGVGFHALPDGLWGIMRVYSQPAAADALNPTPLLNVDNPLASGYHPLMPLETSATIGKVTNVSDLTARPATVVFGKATTLSGKLSMGDKAVANQPVILEQKPAGARNFSKLGTPKSTDQGGNFSFTDVKPRKNTEYRVRFAGDQQNSLKPASSPTKQVKVRVRVSSKVSAASIKRGKVVSVSGVVAPRHAGKVKLTIKRGTQVVANKAAPLKNSRYSFRYKTTRPGRYTVVASFAGDRDHLGNKSPIQRFRVTR